MNEFSISVLGRFTVMVVAVDSFAAGAAFCARLDFAVCETRMLEESTTKEANQIVVFKVSSSNDFQMIVLGISALGFVLGSNGKSSPATESLLTDLQNRRCLLAFVFAALDHANN